MANVAFDAFLPEVMTKLPGCAEPLALTMIRESAIAFCERTLFWQELQDAVAVDSLTLPVDLDAPMGARVCRVLAVWFNSLPVPPATLDRVDASPAGATVGGSMVYYQPDSSTLSLSPLPMVSGDLRLRAAYAPLRSATRIDSSIWESFGSAIAAGAVARLMREPGQSYSNPQGSEVYALQFERAVTRARVDINRSFARGALQVQMHPLA